nr:MAG TPA: hypothetical protein [Caudoviricetes sp.]
MLPSIVRRESTWLFPSAQRPCSKSRSGLRGRLLLHDET